MTIKEYKKKYNLTNEDIGKLLEVDKSTIGKVLTGNTKLSLNLYLKIKSVDELKDLDLQDLVFSTSLEDYLCTNNIDSTENYNPQTKTASVNKEEPKTQVINKEQFKGTLMQQIKISEALDQLKVIKEDIVNLENILK